MISSQLLMLAVASVLVSILCQPNVSISETVGQSSFRMENDHVTNSQLTDYNDDLMYVSVCFLVCNFIIRMYTVFRKKHPLTFSSISSWMMSGF